MKRYKIYWIIAFSLLSLPAIAQRSFLVKRTKVDSAWAKVNATLYDLGVYSTQNSFLRYREEGLKFWKMFPTDTRRYDWLFRTVRDLGGYMLYLNIGNGSIGIENILSEKSHPKNEYRWPMNKKSLEDWEMVYPKLKKEFLTYCDKNRHIGFGGNSPGCNQEIGLLVGELWSFLELSLNKEYRTNQKIDLVKLNYLFTTIINVLDKEPDSKEGLNARIRDRNEFYEILGWAFIDRYKEYGLNVNDMKDFFNSIINANTNETAKRWAIQRKSLFALDENPLSFKHVSMDGDIIDLEKMRGNVVLVDFWSTSCSSCIERMAAIKTVYDKYKTQGFQVISACLNRGDETERIRKIEEKIGADWPTLMIGGKTKEDKPNSLGNQIWKKYGFWGVPQLLLLDKWGKLVMLNDALRDGDFEPTLKRLLAENYESNSLKTKK